MSRRRPLPCPAVQRERVGLAAAECIWIDVPAAGPSIVRLMAGGTGETTLLDSAAGTTLEVQQWACAACDA